MRTITIRTEDDRIVEIMSRLSITIRKMLNNEEKHNDSTLAKLHTTTNRDEFLEAFNYFSERPAGSKLLTITDEDRKFVAGLDTDKLYICKLLLSIGLQKKDRALTMERNRKTFRSKLRKYRKHKIENIGYLVEN